MFPPPKRLTNTGDDHFIPRCPPPAIWRLRPEHETVVSLCGGLVALLPISSHPSGAEIGHEYTRFAGDVGTHVPGIGAGHQRRVDDAGDMRDPLLLRLDRCFDRREVVLAQIREARRDPLDMLLD